MRPSRHIITSVFSLFLLFAQAQELPFDSVSGKYLYEGSILYGKETQNQAENLVFGYLANSKNYRFIRKDTTTILRLVFKGSLAVSYKKSGGVANTGYIVSKDLSITSSKGELFPAGNVDFTIEITFGSNQLNYMIFDFIHFGTGEIGNGGPLEGYPECGADKIGTYPNWEFYRQQAATEAMSVTDGLKRLFKE